MPESAEKFGGLIDSYDIEF